MPGEKEPNAVPPTTETTPGPKEKGTKIRDASESMEGQSTLDKHFRPISGASEENLDSRLQALSETLTKLASQEYIESKFKQMITAEFLSSKLKDLENEVKSQVKKEIDKINKQVSDLRSKVTSVENTVEVLQNQMSDMETNVEGLRKENKEMRDENRKMKEQLAERELKITKQADEINNLEQYTRTNSVRIYGVADKNPKESAAETAKQVVSMVNSKLGLRVSTSDIDVEHRMGRHNPDANRPIICKFVSRFTKYDVIRTRRELKGTVIVIREDLTFQNAKLLEKLSTTKGVRAAWSDRGKVLALLNNGKKLVVDRRMDINRIANA